VVDNGIGMTPIQAAGLVQNRRETNSNHGFNKIGVNNVHQRIKLNFGEAYGLTIQSEQGKGTTVILTLPLINDDSLPTRSAAYA
jgi:two-component system sensor histidine kinase YesM